VIEAQRTLAELVLAKGHVEEAERWALSAVETVGMQDTMSRANVRMVLGLVRAARGATTRRSSCSATRSTRSRRPTTGTPSRAARRLCSLPSRPGPRRRGGGIEERLARLLEPESAAPII
jgi:hypothetical protein